MHDNCHYLNNYENDLYIFNLILLDFAAAAINAESIPPESFT